VSTYLYLKFDFNYKDGEFVLKQEKIPKRGNTVYKPCIGYLVW